MKIAAILFLAFLAGCSQLETKPTPHTQDEKIKTAANDAAPAGPEGIVMFKPGTDNTYVISCAPRASNDPYNTARIRANAYFLEKVSGSEIHVEKNQRSRVNSNGEVKHEYSSSIQSRANGLAHSQVEKHWTEGGVLCLKVSSLIH